MKTLLIAGVLLAAGAGAARAADHDCSATAATCAVLASENVVADDIEVELARQVAADAAADVAALPEDADPAAVDAGVSDEDAAAPDAGAGGEDHAGHD